MRSRRAVRALSELCLTSGALVVLFVVYLLYWTGVRADSAMDGEIGRLRDQWARHGGSAAVAPPTVPDAPPGEPRPDAAPPAPAPVPAPADGTGVTAPAVPGATASPAPPASPAPRTGGTAAPAAPPRAGAAFAVMYVPRFGTDWAKPVLEGTGLDTLKRGLGHYEGSAPLGGTGNFAVAGHRRTHGDPFKDLPRLRPGDAVLLTDGTTWFTYRVDTRPYRTAPTDTRVLDPVPAAAGYAAPGRYLTLTTCDPEWGHSHRLVVWAHLETTAPAAP
ncbi:hypothetical protein GCM10010218_25980 [Streptomyces mashuensis]|uniref:Class E sortase n=1 Tax=Streptomyces mashuensis TaxID=33904 RepID=A0A919B381_9ACTN|nr:class E sortase [Streptomyces mashuensis]GHF43471.1 hypothetical protein GCM10010218_25980 [Streptomyces mashuensis]